jgi:hypothetical protein
LGEENNSLMLDIERLYKVVEAKDQEIANINNEMDEYNKNLLREGA